MSSVTITGDKALDRKLASLKSSTARKALAAGMRASLKPIQKALRTGVNGASISTGLKRAARATIGQRMKRERGAGYSAKVGFGVGKPSKVKKRKAHARHMAGLQGESRGIGISANNIHWMVLGTAPRNTQSGKSTGQVPPLLEGIIKTAFASAQSSSLTLAKGKIWSVIEREAKRG